MATKAFEKIKETEKEAEDIRLKANENGSEIRKKATDDAAILIKNEIQKANEKAEKLISDTDSDVKRSSETALSDYSKECEEIKSSSYSKFSSVLDHHIDHLLK